MMKLMLMNAQREIANNIKIILFKENDSLLKKINIENNNIFLQPLLFSYFNCKKNNSLPKEILEEILQGYFIKKEKIKINHSFNSNRIAYIPKAGYFIKGQEEPFSPIQIISGTKIEVLAYSHPLLDFVFMIASYSNNKITNDNFVIDQKLLSKNINYLTLAFQYIKKTSSQHFSLIQKVCKKIVLFKTNPNNTNSFATINAHGMAFINVYQEDYDEVFFVDDIAHQTGHIILTTILFERKKYFKINENQNISVITNKKSEYRSFYILFHALFTYYTSLLCLDNCINNRCFNTRQTHEAKGRIGFYINKLILDMNNFIKVIEYFKGIEFVLTNDGIEIYNIMRNTFNEIITKWYSKSKNYDYKNQPYNFTYKEFIKLNPINNA